MDVDRALNGTGGCPVDPDASPFRVLTGTPPPPDTVRTGPRTGVGGDGAAHPWRFWIEGDPTVSPYRAHTPRRRNTQSPRPRTLGQAVMAATAAAAMTLERPEETRDP